MSGKGAKKAPKKKGANGYKLPDPIPPGEVLTDIAKKQWVIGPSIGVGGFGEIYSAASYTGGSVKNFPYVIKIVGILEMYSETSLELTLISLYLCQMHEIEQRNNDTRDKEPHENGPLFVEMHFYMRNAKPIDITAWKKEHKLSFLGMPSFIGSGSHECHKTKYRFVVMERFGKNLWDLFQENNRKFLEHTVYKVALQIINVLEYMHHKTYVHADIKGANLLQSSKSPDQIYLVDFGLASHYTNKTEYKADPKKTHNGTIEYTSRDMHMGIPTMRGDFEILVYNMIQWLSGSLPWEKNLTDPSAVQKQKEKAFEDIRQFLDKCFSHAAPEPITKFIKLLDTVKFNEAPNYAKFKEILVKGLQEIGHKPEEKLEFSGSGKAPKASATPNKPKKLQVNPTRKSPRAGKEKSPSLSPSVLNNSDLASVIINKKGKGHDRRRILKNIEITDDSDAEIEIKIKRKRKNKKDENMEISTTDTNKKIVKQSSKKLVTQYDDLDETVSDDETQGLLQGTKSRPKVTLKRKKKAIKLEESIDVDNDSEKDMFDDGDGDQAQATPPKKPVKSWKDAPTVKNGNVHKPGEYKQGKTTRVQRR